MYIFPDCNVNMAPADFFNYLVYLSLVYDESIWLKSFTRISKFNLSLIFEKYIAATTRDSKKTVFCLFKIQKNIHLVQKFEIQIQICNSFSVTAF